MYRMMSKEMIININLIKLLFKNKRHHLLADILIKYFELLVYNVIYIATFYQNLVDFIEVYFT